jgi:radical SAM superfamily enzyme YgiQ (UPF0313 family)
MADKGTIYLVCQGRPDNRRTHVPYGILYVGQALRQAGYRVRLFHLFEDRERPLLEAIRESRPLFVGFSNFLSPLLEYDIRLSQKVHALGVPVVWGGVYSTVCPEIVLAADYVDYIVMGEGEATAPLLAEALRNRVLPEGMVGVGYKQQGERVITPHQASAQELDRMAPAWDLIDLESYRTSIPGTDIPNFAFFLSRGCPFHCTFCYNQADPERSHWRIHSPDYVREQLGYLQKRLRLRAVSLLGDNPFAYSQKGQESIQAVAELGLRWASVARVETVGKEFTAWAQQAGAWWLGFGIESGSERILRMMRKGFNLNQARHCFECLAPTGISLEANWMFFLPDETEQDRQLSYALMNELYRLNPNSYFTHTWFRPYPRTPLWQRCLELGWKPPGNNEEWAACSADKSYAPFSPWSAGQSNRLAWALIALYRYPAKAPGFGPLTRKVLQWRLREGSFRLPLEDVAVALLRKARAYRSRSHRSSQGRSLIQRPGG